MKLLTLAIVISAAMIVGAILMTNRYTFEVSLQERSVATWRMDQITGETRMCFFRDVFDAYWAGEAFTQGDCFYLNVLHDRRKNVPPDAVPM